MLSWQERERLEEAAAGVLGRILMEFGSLEAGLALVIAWARGGHELEAMSKKMAGLKFEKRLRLLGAVLEEKSRDSVVTEAYESWLQDAHRMRIKRNDFVYGRWAVTGDGRVANVVGVMTGPGQVETRYSLDELTQVWQRMKDLRQRLTHLHEKMRLG